MNPILIDLGFIEIRWYSFLILIAFIIGYFLVINRCKKKNINISTISDMCFYLVIVCLLGARIYYCLFNLDYYGKNLLDIFKVWEGGLAIHGGIIAGIIFLYFYTKKKKLNLLELMDIFVPALVLGQAIGRWGNFFNGEAFGPVTNFSTLSNLHIPKFIIDGMYIEHSYHHPTFFYESLGCILIFVTVMIVRNLKRTKDGQITGIYFVLYGIIRFLIEGLRQDSLMFFNLKIAQIISIIMIIVGIYFLLKPCIKIVKGLNKLFKR